MSDKEYQFVEKPFLQRLTRIGWQVIDQKAMQLNGQKLDPSTSLRTNYKQVTLKDTFKESVKKINQANGKAWLTDKQLDDLYDEITATEKKQQALYQSNKEVFKKLLGIDKTTVNKNELTGETNATVQLIDFDNWQNNRFIAINQFNISNPIGSQKQVIPDIVLFVNGLPLVVVECKALDVSNPISEGINQLKRYENQREGKQLEGCEKLFHYNLFSIVTHGEDARFGTISGNYDYYYNWKDIFPETYQTIQDGSNETIDIDQYNETERQTFKFNGLNKAPNVRQNVCIQGLLNKEILLDVLRHFTVFEEDEEKNVKIVSRYQQYRAVGKIINRLRNGSGDDRSGVVWHTQGSGKSFTMGFLVRKMQTQADLKDYKIILMVDRNSLEDQLSKTIKTSEDTFNINKNIIQSRKEVQEKLSGNDAGIYMAMIHKFAEVKEAKHAKSLQNESDIPEVQTFKPFDVVNDSDRVLILLDEAHRTHGGDMSTNMFDAFPNSVKIAFTGTPLITDRHNKKTLDHFGSGNLSGDDAYIDTYKIMEAVADRATLELVYVSKTSTSCVFNKKELNQTFENEFAKETAEVKDAIQKKYGNMQKYLENKDRLQKNATDMVNHYIDNILGNGFKAMVVANSIYSAVKYEEYILNALKERIANETDEDLKAKLITLDAVSVVTKTHNEEAFIEEAHAKAKKVKAIDAFKKDFDYSNDKNFAFICVCDKLLTGFDAPIAQVMYIDKSLKEHNLLQAIARVNRTKKNKTKGILVDYYGIFEHLQKALELWGGEEQQEILEGIRNINEEIPILESRYKRLVQFYKDNGVDKFEDFLHQKTNDAQTDNDIVDACVELNASVPFRAESDVMMKEYFHSYDLLCTIDATKDYHIPTKRLGLVSAIIKKTYRDSSSTKDISFALPKVRKIIDDYVTTVGGIETSDPVDLLSDKFMDSLGTDGGSEKAKAVEMIHAVRTHIDDKLDFDPTMYEDFSIRLDKLSQRYDNNWAEMLGQLSILRDDIVEGKRDIIAGLNEDTQPFYDVIIATTEQNSLDDAQQQSMVDIVNDVYKKIETASQTPNFWEIKQSEQEALKKELFEVFIVNDVAKSADTANSLISEIMKLAKIRQESDTSIDE